MIKLTILKTKYRKPVLYLTSIDRDDQSIIIDKARSVAAENNMDWSKIYNQIKDAHENCILLLELSKHFKIN